jgi:hypothetical protein
VNPTAGPAQRPPKLDTFDAVILRALDVVPHELSRVGESANQDSGELCRCNASHPCCDRRCQPCTSLSSSGLPLSRGYQRGTGARSVTSFAPLSIEKLAPVCPRFVRQCPQLLPPDWTSSR